MLEQQRLLGTRRVAQLSGVFIGSAVLTGAIMKGSSAVEGELVVPPATDGIRLVEHDAPNEAEVLVPNEIVPELLEPELQRSEAELLEENKLLRAQVEAAQLELTAYGDFLSKRIEDLTRQQSALLMQGQILNQDYKDFLRTLSEDVAKRLEEVKALEREVAELATDVQALEDSSRTLHKKVTDTNAESRELSRQISNEERRTAELEAEVNEFSRRLRESIRRAEEWARKPIKWYHDKSKHF
jgi:methyl-accepting chemotaxis protein